MALRKRGKVWYSNITFHGHPQAGKAGLLQIPLDTDRRFAEEKLLRLVEQRNAHKFHRPIQNVRWEDFKNKVLALKSHPVTNRLYQGAIKYLEDHVQIQFLAQLTPAMLSDAKTAWKAAGRGLYIVNRHVRSIKAMMHLAESQGLVKEQDWSSIKEDKEPKGRLLWYTVKELQGLLKHCKGLWKTLALLGARAGLRRSEIYYLTWDDVDFERKRIHISPKPEWTPKDNERRWVPMPSDLEAHLKSLKHEGDHVFIENGWRPSLNSMSVLFKRIIRKAKLKGSPHTLRHTYGSHLANGGATPKIIMELMGHSELEMVDKYLHLAPSTLQNAANCLPKL